MRVDRKVFMEHLAALTAAMRAVVEAHSLGRTRISALTQELEERKKLIAELQQYINGMLSVV